MGCQAGRHLAGLDRGDAGDRSGHDPETEAAAAGKGTAEDRRWIVDGRRYSAQGVRRYFEAFQPEDVKGAMSCTGKIIIGAHNTHNIYRWLLSCLKKFEKKRCKSHAALVYTTQHFRENRGGTGDRPGLSYPQLCLDKYLGDRGRSGHRSWRRKPPSDRAVARRDTNDYHPQPGPGWLQDGRLSAPHQPQTVRRRQENCPWCTTRWFCNGRRADLGTHLERVLFRSENYARMTCFPVSVA